MVRLYAMLDVIGPSPLNVLILGETGVGKEVFAAELRSRSARAQKPFVQLNCAALPESTLEGELFGYERGAFTGAVQAKPGLFESATTGTVFLDEIGDMPLTTQAKLLRVLETGDVLRLGALKPRKVDVRFISATNRDLRRAIADGTFRSDLFYRLNGMTINLPPLRKRPGDIIPLANFFVRRVAEHLRREAPRISPATQALLLSHAWVGNIRELKNVLERAVVISRGGELQPEDVELEEGSEPSMDQRFSGSMGVWPSSEATVASMQVPSPREILTPPGGESVGPPSDSIDPEATAPRSLRNDLKAIERERIIEALAKCGGNQSQAARMLGMSRYTLIARIEQYGLARPRKRP
jgi:transcriptional regulator with GAF, ATPase, and Fis domain